jgi:hypothetical protein
VASSTHEVREALGEAVMAARKKSTKKKTTAKKKAPASKGKQPKFGSAAWFAKYPKAKNFAKKKSSSKSKKK